MKQESLDKVLTLTMQAIDIADIDLFDKMELMLNMKNFLENYDRDLEILKKENRKNLSSERKRKKENYFEEIFGNDLEKLDSCLKIRR